MDDDRNGAGMVTGAMETMIVGVNKEKMEGENGGLLIPRPILTLPPIVPEGQNMNSRGR